MSIQNPINPLNTNPNQQVRQNLINEPNQLHSNIQMQPIPVLISPNNQINFQSNLEFNRLVNLLQTRRTVVPLVPISKYKFYVQIFMFFGCLIEMFFHKATSVHILWFLWYPVLGFHRHQTNKRRIRFFGQLIHLMIWIYTNCYLFSHDKQTIFPLIVLLVNMDYYFFGFNLILTYFCYISYVTWNCCADVRLKLIERKLERRRKQLIKNELQKFRKNEQNNKHESNPSQSIDQSSENVQKTNDQKETKNTCPICLSSLNQQVNFQTKNLQIVRLSCAHRYHYSCLKSWIQTDQSKCPVCRKQMFQ